uniref:R13L1/DRL21-like LRR repeat region domain-containing protein n=1 Tax=Aegilops tauschii TaxID=37682 RepID=R7WD79_AEGTA
MLTKKIPGLQNLRTLIIDDMIKVQSNECAVFGSFFIMFTGLSKLRVLNLRFCGIGLSMFSFPDSIGKLKHLRYFAFRVPQITKLTLPAAFTKLYHMQVVDFGLCINLAFRCGEDMMNLVNLRCVISKADLAFPNIGRLTWLQMLPFFTIKRIHGYESHQLKHLNKLQGKLQIHGLEHVKTKEEAVEIKLAGKERLTELVLVWDHDHFRIPEPEVQAEVLEGLCPSKYLERLEIRNYQAVCFLLRTEAEADGLPNLQALTESLVSTTCLLAKDTFWQAGRKMRSLSWACLWEYMQIPFLRHTLRSGNKQSSGAHEILGRLRITGAALYVRSSYEILCA